MNAAQNRRFHALLNQAGLLEEKKALVRYFSANRTESSKELAPHQVQTLLDWLAAQVPGAAAPRPVAPAPAPTAKRATAYGDEAAHRMRRKIFALARAIGWATGETPEDKAMNAAVVDAFCVARGYLKKPLHQYTTAELPKLVSQWEQIQKHTTHAAANRAVQALLAEAGLSVTTKRAPR